MVWIFVGGTHVHLMSNNILSNIASIEKHMQEIKNIRNMSVENIFFLFKAKIILLYKKRINTYLT